MKKVKWENRRGSLTLVKEIVNIYRRQGKEHGKLTLKVFEKSIRNHIMYYIPKVVYNTCKCRCIDMYFK